MTNATNQHVTRTEFEAGMRRLEALLDKQTAILQSLAVAEVENRVRDDLIKEMREAIAKLQAEQKTHSLKFAWFAGAMGALTVGWQLVSKKLGF